jgi:threonine synthase
MHTALHCALCGRSHDIHTLQNLCTSCGKPLLAKYNFEKLRSDGWSPIVVRKRAERSLWRFREVLPLADGQTPVTLGEGLTPLLKCARRGAVAKFERLYIKDEAANPTASFKARGMTTAITRAAALGVKEVALPSAGNAGGAAAMYAAAAGMKCHVYMPDDTPAANIIECQVAGADVQLIRGLINDCGKLVREGCEKHGWFDLSTLKEPFRVEGKKTMGYELALDLTDAEGLAGGGFLKLPDCIIYPAGGGTGLIGMWKAFDEMQQLGWIGRERPRMVLVQAAGCAPIVTAYEAGKEFAELFPNAATVASGLRVPAAVGDFLMIRAVKQSGGTCVTITDEELLEGVRELAGEQGLFACPEGGAAWKAALRLREQGWLRGDESVVVFNTGSGLKYTHLFEER